MKQFTTLQAAKSFIDNLNIPQSEIEKIEELPQIFRPLNIRLKWADCDLIVISDTYNDKFKKVYNVEKRWYSAPCLAAEAFGMMPNRYKTPTF